MHIIIHYKNCSFALIIINYMDQSDIFQDSFLSSILQECTNCHNLSKSNQRLLNENQALKAELKQQGKMKELCKIGLEIQKFKVLASQYQITMQDITKAITYAFDNIFKIRNDELVQKAGTIFEMFNTLFGINKKQKRQKITQPRLQVIKKVDSYQDSQERTNTSKKTIRQWYQKREHQKEMYLHQQRHLGGKKQQRLIEKRGKTKEAAEQRQKSYIYQNICCPISWEQTSAFKISEKVITKLYNDEYKKMCARSQLPRSGSHLIKCQMIKNGTVAFGIVIQAHKNSRMVDDKKVAVKYLSFENGGGLVKCCGEEISNSKKLHLLQGQILQITFDAERQQLTFKNPNLDRPFVIELPEIFKRTQVYFFIEMKHKNCAIKMM